MFYLKKRRQKKNSLLTPVGGMLYIGTNWLILVNTPLMGKLLSLPCHLSLHNRLTSASAYSIKKKEPDI